MDSEFKIINKETNDNYWEPQQIAFDLQVNAALANWAWNFKKKVLYPELYGYHWKR